MIQCQNCGVTLEENANFCSLCGEPIIEKYSDIDFLEAREKQRKKRMKTDFQKLTEGQKRKLIWEISGLIIFSIMLITLSINLAGMQTITWAKFPITIGLILFINMTLISFMNKRLLLSFLISFISTAVLVVLLDIYTGNSGWVTKLGIPLLLVIYILVYLFVMLVMRVKQKGLNIIAYAIIACGLLSVCIEAIILLHAERSLYFGWSFIVLVSALFTAALLLYIHFRLKKGNDLKRLFHI